MNKIELAIAFPCVERDPPQNNEDIVLAAFTAVVKTRDGEVKETPVIVFWGDGGPRAAVHLNGELVDWDDIPLACTDARCSLDVVDEYTEMLEEGTMPAACRTETR